MMLLRKSFWKIGKRLIFLSISVAVIIGLGRLYFYLTDGFRINNVKSSFSYNPELDIRQLSRDEQDTLDRILAQKFTYLAKGHQAYVFESEDRKYVLKLLKFQRLQINPWLLKIPLPNALHKRRESKVEFKKNMLNELLKSWKLAYEEFIPESGVVYVHINKTNHLNRLLSITDKIGLSYHIDLDNTVFLIQQKAQLICPYIDRLMESNDTSSAEMIIRKLFNLLIEEYKKGLAETDHHLLRNTGVLNSEPIHIDNGRFTKDEKLKDPLNYLPELKRKTAELRKWLFRHHPDLCNFYDEEIQQIAIRNI